MIDKDFDLFIQNQLAGNGHNHIDDLEKLNKPQYEHYQINKRALNRIKAYIKRSDNKETKVIYE